jgi:amino acid transporter
LLKDYKRVSFFIEAAICRVAATAHVSLILIRLIALLIPYCAVGVIAIIYYKYYPSPLYVSTLIFVEPILLLALPLINLFTQRLYLNYELTNAMWFSAVWIAASGLTILSITSRRRFKKQRGNER